MERLMRIPSMIKRPWPAHFPARMIVASLALALAGGPFVRPPLLNGQQQPEQSKKEKRRVPNWNPPQVKWPLKSRISEPACELPGALKLAGDRANGLFDNLRSFTAREDIQFQTLGADNADSSLIMGGSIYSPRSAAESDFSGSYDYVVLYKQTANGLVADDSRNQRGDFHSHMPFDQDLGLTELALMFLPGMQSDFDFKCEGTVNWNGQPAWVIGFQQRKDKPHRTVSFRDRRDSYPASLRGRAWITTDSGGILHIETSLMDEIPEVHVRQWFLSIDYAPVVFQPMNLRMVLPRSVDAYCDYGDRRTIAYHTFSDYKLFSVSVTIRPNGPDAQNQ